MEDVENKKSVDSILQETPISKDDIDIEVAVSNDELVVYVKFSNFEDIEDAEDYAEFLSETLPLLLFETTRIQ